MKSEKFIEWEPYFRQGISLIRPLPLKLTSYTCGDYIRVQDIEETTETITFTERVNLAPKFIDQGIHRANDKWKYYTFKQLPGAVIFLGSK